MVEVEVVTMEVVGDDEAEDDFTESLKGDPSKDKDDSFVADEFPSKT